MKNNDVKELIILFEEANANFLFNNKELIKRDLHERCLVANLAYELRDLLPNYGLNNYFADVEYNRDEYNVKKLIPYELTNKDNPCIICDLIVHDRGESNLIAFEMKKANSNESFDNDRRRLKILTKQESSNYNYKLGIFYILESLDKYSIEYYVDGKLIDANLL